jgi:NADPH:quinone reductase-like Zn-dependent oxidoreductase
MKAIVCTRYGPPEVLKLRNVDKPVPRDNQLLVKVRASTVTAGDCELRSFRIPPSFWIPMRIMVGIRKPRNLILGQELAGTVEAVGARVTQFKEGDDIFAPTSVRFGAHAEYICLSASAAIAVKPESLSFEDAATVPVGGLNALHFLRKAEIQPGEDVLINGAGGSIGTIAVQLAKYYGARVTAVDSAGKLDMLQSIGADNVIDFAREDFTRSGKTYDVILDVVGKSPYSRTIQTLNARGRYLLANPRLTHVVRGLWTSRRSGKKVLPGLASYSSQDLLFLTSLIETGNVTTVIDRSYPLEQTADAHRYVDSGSKTGSVVITI